MRGSIEREKKQQTSRWRRAEVVEEVRFVGPMTEGGREGILKEGKEEGGKERAGLAEPLPPLGAGIETQGMETRSSWYMMYGCSLVL